jgi:Uma2 family endonuclease
MLHRAHRVTEDEYLAADLADEVRLEFVNGEIVAMSGVTDAHSTIRGNVEYALQSQLRGRTPCRVHGPDLRVRIDETGMYAYPDVVVYCGKPDYAPTKPESLLNPRVIVEVLSESTESYDLGAKAAHYRQRPSVQGIVMIDSLRKRVVVWRRLGPTQWQLDDLTDGEFAVPGVEATLSFAAIYEAWTPPGEADTAENDAPTPTTGD